MHLIWIILGLLIGAITAHSSKLLFEKKNKWLIRMCCLLSGFFVGGGIAGLLEQLFYTSIPLNSPEAILMISICSWLFYEGIVLLRFRSFRSN